nr:MAG TPA: hypothetical protein [Caudoviricetes sp.]
MNFLMIVSSSSYNSIRIFLTISIYYSVIRILCYLLLLIFRR